VKTGVRLMAIMDAPLGTTWCFLAEEKRKKIPSYDQGSKQNRGGAVVGDVCHIMQKKA